MLCGRRQGLARRLMEQLEVVTEKVHKAYFVDLFVRAGNAVAVKMYENVRPHCWTLLHMLGIAWPCDAWLAAGLWTEACVSWMLVAAEIPASH